MDVKFLSSLLNERHLMLESPFVLLYAFIFELLLLGLIIKTFNLPVDQHSYYIHAFVIVFLVTILFWLQNRRLPTFNKEKLGILLILKRPRDVSDAEQINIDFVESFKSSISSHGGGLFEIKETNSYFTSKIDSLEVASRLSHKVKSVAVIYGRAVKRIINKEEKYVVMVDAYFHHAPLTEEQKKEYLSVIGATWFKKYYSNKDNSILGLEVTSKVLTTSVLYIIGQAAFYTNNGNIAEKIFRSVLELSKSGPQIAFIKENIYRTFSYIMLAKAKFFYNSWKEKYDEEFLDKMYPPLTEIKGEMRRSYDTKLLLAIYYIAKDNDIRAAKREIGKVNKKNQGASWLFNMAFLHFLSGDTKKARDNYLKATSFHADIELILELEQFMIWYGEKYQYHQIYLLLAMLNLYIKPDLVQANNDLETYRKLCNTKSSKILVLVESDLKNQ